MKVSRAILGGIVGALAMSLAMFLMRRAGIDVSLEGLLGTLLPGRSWIGGLALHLLIGALVGLIYAVVFEYAVQRSGALVGAGLGVAHGLVAGLFMSGIAAMNPLDLNYTSAPGAFLSNLKLGPVVFLALHCLYGLVVGLMYGHPLQKEHLYHGPHPV